MVPTQPAASYERCFLQRIVGVPAEPCDLVVRWWAVTQENLENVSAPPATPFEFLAVPRDGTFEVLDPSPDATDEPGYRFERRRAQGMISRHLEQHRWRGWVRVDSNGFVRQVQLQSGNECIHFSLFYVEVPGFANRRLANPPDLVDLRSKPRWGSRS